MPRSSRLFIDNACYHLRTRGNQKQNVFLNEQDYQKCLEIIKRAKSKYNIHLYAYCLMTNHFHLLIQTFQARNISKFMQWINRGYTAYFNAQYKKVGHLWQGRFQSSPIVKGQYLVNVATYIENNPVRAGIANDPVNYKWSSYQERCIFTKKYLVDPIKLDCSISDG